MSVCILLKLMGGPHTVRCLLNGGQPKIIAVLCLSRIAQVIMALTLHYRIMLHKITTSKLMIKVVEFVVKGSRLSANTINGNDMQCQIWRAHSCYTWNLYDAHYCIVCSLLISLIGLIPLWWAMGWVLLVQVVEVTMADLYAPAGTT